MSEDDVSRDYMARVEALLARNGSPMTPIAAGMIVAIGLGIAGDSRTFSRILGIAHALVLREVETLSAAGLLQVIQRDARTQRTRYALTPAGEAMLDGAP